MNRLLCGILTCMMITVGVRAQRLVIGEKAPEVRVSTWLDGRTPSLNGKACLVDFFHSSNDQCVANLSKLNTIQNSYNGSLNVVLLSREDLEKIRTVVEGKGYGFYIGQDDGGKSFNGYGIRFVPFSALVDARGRLVWTGNVSSLSNDTIDKALK